jgi:hypothetical protein
MTLSLQIYADYTRSQLLADYSNYPFRFSTNAHGFASLELPFVPESLPDAFAAYDWPGTPWAVVTGDDGTAWEGRLEDITIVPGGVQLAALGAWRAMGDVTYTSLWSVTGTAEWEPLDNRQVTDNYPDRYEMDNNNRVHIRPVKNATLGNTSGNKIGRMGYAVPQTSRNIVAVSFDYALRAPTGWTVGLQLWTVPYPVTGGVWTLPAIVWTLAGNGSLQTGTQTLSGLTGATGLTFFMLRGAADATYTSETGTDYLKITNIRIKSTSASTVLASNIAAALATYVNGVNPGQLNSSTALIEATTDDLQDEIYEDIYPADILDRLAFLHGYEAGVWENRQLHFRPKGSAGRHWYVDVTKILNLQRSLENIRNSAYGVYQDANGRALRTAVTNDANSQARLGIVRRAPVEVRTTSVTQAAVHRDVFLTDRANFQTRAEIEFETLEDEAGAEYPLYMMRAGDTVTMRNLPPVLSEAIDNIRTFLIGETEIQHIQGQPLSISMKPETPVPTLVTLVARREAGLR